MARLYIFAGLPGTGKTTLARKLARHLNAVYLRIDTIEAALRDLCGLAVKGEGYRLAYRIAADNLQLGGAVVADACNPIELTRREWEEVAETNGAEFVHIEVICSDADEHRSRVESRVSNAPSVGHPTWKDVRDRAYDDWSRPRLIVDTAGSALEASFVDLIDALRSTWKSQ